MPSFTVDQQYVLGWLVVTRSTGKGKYAASVHYGNQYGEVAWQSDLVPTLDEALDDATRWIEFVEKGMDHQQGRA